MARRHTKGQGVKRTYRIGRRRDSDIVVSDPSVSRDHAEMIVDGGDCFLTDRGSRLGTFALRDDGWHKIRQAWVEPDQPILLGDYETTSRALLDGIEPPRSVRADTARLLPGAIRRFVAVMAADVVGYSGMMAHDEAGTLARYRTLLSEVVDPAVARSKGRVFKTMGDGFLAEFSTPLMAMRCATTIQRASAVRGAAERAERRLHLRIGINCGDVISDGDDLFGDCVNLAARLESIAEPGGICLSAAARDLIGDALPFTYRDWGERAVKNIPTPVHAYHVDPDEAPAP